MIKEPIAEGERAHHACNIMGGNLFMSFVLVYSNEHVNNTVARRRARCSLRNAISIKCFDGYNVRRCKFICCKMCILDHKKLIYQGKNVSIMLVKTNWQKYCSAMCNRIRLVQGDAFYQNKNIVYNHFQFHRAEH